MEFSSLGPRWLASRPPQLLSDGEFPHPISTHWSNVVDNCDLTDWHAGSYFLMVLAEPLASNSQGTGFRLRWVIPPLSLPNSQSSPVAGLSNQSITFSQPLWLAQGWICDPIRDHPRTFAGKTKDRNIFLLQVSWKIKMQVWSSLYCPATVREILCGNGASIEAHRKERKRRKPAPWAFGWSLTICKRTE